ncbi:cysteine-rich motor neuron 1 protein-like [Phymastichus coffea]|uniref:cysteine-rich motor neuron 1 protein-like n=1 Tax=Phymastichus coffea TaxID=108790 RepID=UPI00273BEF7B|nr:cysteine-rich motor neuron 1 protein-like [Phymastichus coffea]
MLRQQFAALLPLLLLLLAGGAGGEACPEDSVSSEDGSGCRCIPECPRHECPAGTRRTRVRDAVPEQPGSCCPLYECRDQAPLNYDSAEEAGWAAAQQCVDDRGQPRQLGEHWLETDPCTNCSCEAPGRPRCQTTMCRSCARPRPRHPDECCPRCPEAPQQQRCAALRDCAPAARGCPHGLLRDRDDCEVCQCRPRADCPRRLRCPARCGDGYRLDRRSGCPVCQCLDSCLDEAGRRRLEGERWSPDACRSCACGPAGAVGCNRTLCAAGCPLPPPPGRCCALCPPPQEAEAPGGGGGGWGPAPIALVAVLGLLCAALLAHLARGRLRARLRAAELDFAGFPQLHRHPQQPHHPQQQQQQQQHQQQHQQQQQPQQYYKCVPAYEPVLRHAEKIAAL